MATATHRSTLLPLGAATCLHSYTHHILRTVATLFLCIAAHAQTPSGILTANAPTLYLVLSVSGKYFVPFTPVKGTLVMQAITSAAGLSDQDVSYTVGPDFQVCLKEPPTLTA